MIQSVIIFALGFVFGIIIWNIIKSYSVSGRLFVPKRNFTDGGNESYLEIDEIEDLKHGAIVQIQVIHINEKRR